MLLSIGPNATGYAYLSCISLEYFVLCNLTFMVLADHCARLQIIFTYLLL